MHAKDLPVAIIGAGPIGLAAAAHLVERGIPIRIYEAGETVGANIRDWAHVRIFTTWEQSVDTASRRLLEASGWALPEPDGFPTGDDLYRHYLKPLSRLSTLAPYIHTHARVTRATRLGVDKTSSTDRESKPFELHLELGDGRQRTDLARAVIDASGTWQNPNPLGASGLEAEGERALGDHIAYGMPDVLGAQRSRYADRRIAVVGGGYSAINVLLDLAQLCKDAAKTKVSWIVRSKNMNRIYGGGEADQLPARGKLGNLLRPLVEQGRISLVSGFHTNAVAKDQDGLVLRGRVDNDSVEFPGLDEIIVCTGQRPDLDMTRELRLELDPWLEGVKALGPLIDPNLHSCGSVPPHGHREVSHPEPGFYTIGVKSYGRAPTFLLLTGYEQARSVVAAIAGDLEAADNVQFVLPETGICKTDFFEDGAGCCGGPAPDAVSACCVADNVAKLAGKEGCGCGTAA
ncbi:MAG TPA: NAD(P)-binding domain-containing protein [Dongiaceae bacterium]|jgi:thioredoxin reductase|nr:NAD(P)-binding domain-containing protein [Dongiaceae bacterium]